MLALKQESSAMRRMNGHRLCSLIPCLFPGLKVWCSRSYTGLLTYKDKDDVYDYLKEVNKEHKVQHAIDKTAHESADGSP